MSKGLTTDARQQIIARAKQRSEEANQESDKTADGASDDGNSQASVSSEPSSKASSASEFSESGPSSEDNSQGTPEPDFQAPMPPGVDDEPTSESSVDSESTSSESSKSSSSESNSMNPSEAVSSEESKQASLRADSAYVHEREARDFLDENGQGGTKDPQVLWLMHQATKAVTDYVTVATDNYKNDKKPTQKEFYAQMERLKNIPKAMSEAIVGMWLENNDSILHLQKQVDDLKREKDIDKSINPTAETHLLIRWVKRGIPTQIEKDFYRLDKIANDPRFQTFLNSNHFDGAIPVPSAVTSMYSSVSAENSAHENSSTATSSTSSSKGGQ